MGVNFQPSTATLSPPPQKKKKNSRCNFALQATCRRKKRGKVLKAIV